MDNIEKTCIFPENTKPELGGSGFECSSKMEDGDSSRILAEPPVFNNNGTAMTSGYISKRHHKLEVKLWEVLENAKPRVDALGFNADTIDVEISLYQLNRISATGLVYHV